MGLRCVYPKTNSYIKLYGCCGSMTKLQTRKETNWSNNKAAPAAGESKKRNPGALRHFPMFNVTILEKSCVCVCVCVAGKHGNLRDDRFQDTCYVDAFRSLAFKIPYTALEPFWVVTDGENMLAPFGTNKSETTISNASCYFGAPEAYRPSPAVFWPCPAHSWEVCLVRVKRSNGFRGDGSCRFHLNQTSHIGAERRFNRNDQKPTRSNHADVCRGAMTVTKGPPDSVTFLQH